MPLFAPTTRFPDRFCRLSLTTTTTPCVTRLLSTRLSVRRYATRRKNSGERWASSHGVFHRLFSYSPILKGLLIDKLMGLVILVAEFNVPRATLRHTLMGNETSQRLPLPFVVDITTQTWEKNFRVKISGCASARILENLGKITSTAIDALIRSVLWSTIVANFEDKHLIKIQAISLYKSEDSLEASYNYSWIAWIHNLNFFSFISFTIVGFEAILRSATTGLARRGFEIRRNSNRDRKEFDWKRGEGGDNDRKIVEEGESIEKCRLGGSN